jgi:hypothetical protein
LHDKNIKGYGVIENFIILAKCWCGSLLTLGLYFYKTKTKPPPPPTHTMTTQLSYSRPPCQGLGGSWDNEDPSHHGYFIFSANMYRSVFC